MNDTARYLRELSQSGYEITKSRRRNHWIIRRGNELVATASSSSRSPASLRDLRAHVKRFEAQQRAGQEAGR